MKNPLISITISPIVITALIPCAYTQDGSNTQELELTIGFADSGE